MRSGEGKELNWTGDNGQLLFTTLKSKADKAVQYCSDTVFAEVGSQSTLAATSKCQQCCWVKKDLYASQNMCSNSRAGLRHSQY